MRTSRNQLSVCTHSVVAHTVVAADGKHAPGIGDGHEIAFSRYAIQLHLVRDSHVNVVICLDQFESLFASASYTLIRGTISVSAYVEINFFALLLAPGETTR